MEPLGLLRTNYRMFRMDRIQKYRPRRSTHGYHEHMLKAFLVRSLQKETDLRKMVVRFDQNMICYIRYKKYYHEWSSEKEVAG
ncbi:WYL domain-containing protein [Fodinibius sediminis]|uniref:WYL domain-containing protein n=1 Tax=Fodinibius sediminis TaxID=1214077 RepID=A0A521BH44_9BACT|nr:WYL domain-containing protein [Fodinibius sediminis]SMO46349.1 WYL domain-containing protein [Fodinibius sediminis]